MNFMYFIDGVQVTRFQASVRLANFYGGDPEYLMVTLESMAREYLVSTGEPTFFDRSGVAVSWA